MRSESGKRFSEMGGHEIAARRAIATLTAIQVKPSFKQVSLAEEHAALASRLTAQQDWSCELAVALAASAADHQDRAVSALETARDLALGSNRTTCDEIGKLIKKGAPIPWPF